MSENGAAWITGDVVVDGVSLHYHRTGGARPALVLLHGITDDGLCWTRVARDLGDEFDIVMPDARGHGRSDRLATGFSIPRLAADVAGLLDGLGIASALVFGHSMGAITAAALAAERPDLVRGLVLEDPPLEEHAPPPPGLLEAMRADAARWPTLAASERLAAATAQNRAWHPLENGPWADAKAAVDPAVMDQFGSFRGYDWRAAFARLRCPGLLVTGDPALHSIVSPATAAEAVRIWPAGQILHVEGAGHCIHRDRWEATMAPVRAFLRAQARAAS